MTVNFKHRGGRAEGGRVYGWRAGCAGVRCYGGSGGMEGGCR